MELPEWTDIVKTATFKELAPYDPDWYYIRAGKFFLFLFSHNYQSEETVKQTHILQFQFAASIARKIYLRGGLGVGALQRIYGGRKRNGSAPPHFCKSSGGIARHILQ